jgi:hypothetical protein
MCEHQAKAVIYLDGEVSDIDALHMLRSLRAQRHSKTLSIGVLHANAPARLIRPVDVLLDVPACAKALKDSCFFPFWMRFATPLHYTLFASA